VTERSAVRKKKTGDAAKRCRFESSVFGNCTRRQPGPTKKRKFADECL
jgi:hypothetical protein